MTPEATGATVDEQIDETPPTSPTRAEIFALARECRYLIGASSRQVLRSPKEVLLELAEWADPAWEADTYGEGELIASLERDVAELLGMEAGVFVPSGTMAQQLALRVWADRTGVRTVAMHPQNHLDDPELRAYEHIHNLRGIAAGQRDRLLTLDDLKGIAEPVGTLLLELPQREIGGQLPSWDELNAISDWARERGIVLHMDGARLWESAPFYGKAYSEIAALFDTVYVSFYKGLGGISGAMLLGPERVIAAARVWQKRHGGRLFKLYPYVLSARKGLAERLPRMPEYYARAVQIAEVLSRFPRIEVVPNPPHTYMMHVFIQGNAEQLNAAALDYARETGVFLFHGTRPTQLPGWQLLELAVGEANVDTPLEVVEEAFGALFARA